MKKRLINSEDALTAPGYYAQAVEINSPERLLFISGQIPVDADGSVPDGFADQARLAWSNIEAQLNAAGMALENIVKHTTFLSDRRYCDLNSKIRREALGDLEPALTIVICDIYDEKWLLEIEAVAAA